MKSSVVRRATVVMLLIVVLILAFTLSNDMKQHSGNGNSFALASPPFVDVAYAESGSVTDFPEDEIGIAAYFQAPAPVDLNDVVPVYRTIEVQTSDYIIGSVPVPNYASESEDVHVYVHVDGWVMGYYLAADPAVKIIDWSVYNGATIVTKFDTVLTTVAAAIGTTLPATTYYDFRYPNATDLLLVAEAQYNTGADSFEVNLPSNFVYYERSWSLSCRDVPFNANQAEYYLNSTEIYSTICPGGDWTNEQGLLTNIQLPPDVFHTIEIMTNSADGFGGLALVYLVP